MKRIYIMPQDHLLFAVPTVLIFSLLFGLYVDTSALSVTVTGAVIVMIFATMVGLKMNELTKLNAYKKLLTTAMLVNFIWVPFVATIIGFTVLRDEPHLFAGLALVALLPTSGMTIAWTGLQKGNVPAGIKLTVFGLVAGALLTPWYLLLMVGEYVPINIGEILQTIFLVVAIPLILGQVVTKLLQRRFSAQEFQKKVKPAFAPLSIWGLLYIVFVSTSARAEMLVNNLSLLAVAAIAILLFFAANFVFATWVAARFFKREDGIALVNGTVLRNLSIAVGIAAASFDAEAALLVTLAFMVQYQSITYYAKIAGRRWFRPKELEA
nr:bile acid:sodium symporter [Salsuginibacillus halophilus]